MERLTKCPLCKSGLFLNLQEIQDFAVSKQLFMICKCSLCHLLFTNPRPKEEDILSYYDFPTYYSHEDQSKSLIQLVYQIIRKISIYRKAKLFESLFKKGRILDYGCGTGNVLEEMSKRNWDITGIEPNEKARKIANSKTYNKVFKTMDEFSETKKFDIISLFHVLEHIHDLRPTIKKLLNILKKSGSLIIAIPNHQSWDSKYYQKSWAAWDVPRHLYHFDSESIVSLANRFNLEITSIKPLPFDSFYVSLLSEINKNPKQYIITTYIKSILCGIKSNHFAKKKVIPYSSNIYIFKKKSDKI